MRHVHKNIHQPTVFLAEVDRFQRVWGNVDDYRQGAEDARSHVLLRAGVNPYGEATQSIWGADCDHSLLFDVQILKPWEVNIGQKPRGLPLKNLKILASIMHRIVEVSLSEVWLGFALPSSRLIVLCADTGDHRAGHAQHQ